jgi:radical SAM protein with 4Fe4S-binding SPASM domain
MPKNNLKEIVKSESSQKERYITLIVTSNCNLSCKYCYEKHELRDKKIMDFSIAKEVISHYMKEDWSQGVEIDFMGGEPLLGFEFIRDVVDWIHTQSWDKDHRFLIGTNGTILNNEMKEWLYKNRQCVYVAVSLDGTRKAHNISRSNSYDLVSKNLPFFKKYWSHQPAKMTICAETIPHIADSVIEMEEMGLNFTANIGFEDQWGDEMNKEKLLYVYEEQLARLVEYYTERSDLHPVSPLISSVPEYLGIPNYGESKQREIKRFCGAGHEMVAIDVDGKKYPCHRFVPWITNKPAPKENVNCQNAWKPESCENCKLIPSCPTCAGYNWEVNNDTGIRTTFHCEAYKLGVMAACKLEWNRLKQKLSEVDDIPDKDKKRLKMRLEAIWSIIENFQSGQF